MRQPHGSGQIPPGKSLNEIENISDDTDSPARRMLTQMLENPEPSYDPDDKNSLFWAIGRKFTAEMKVKFLQMTAKYGRVGLAAHSVGISKNTVATHRATDKRFDELVREAESFYREATAAVIMQQAREGLIERKWNSAGQLISERRTYETQLRIKLLDWCDPSFNSAQKQEITVKGGAVMVPGPVDSVEDWNSVLAALNDLEKGANKPAIAATFDASSTDIPAALPVNPDESLDSLDNIAFSLPSPDDPDVNGD